MTLPKWNCARSYSNAGACSGAPGLTWIKAAEALCVTQARAPDINRGKVGSFGLDRPVRLVGRAGLNPRPSHVA